MVSNSSKFAFTLGGVIIEGRRRGPPRQGLREALQRHEKAKSEELAVFFDLGVDMLSELSKSRDGFLRVFVSFF